MFVKLKLEGHHCVATLATFRSSAPSFGTLNCFFVAAFPLSNPPWQMVSAGSLGARNLMTRSPLREMIEMASGSVMARPNSCASGTGRFKFGLYRLIVFEWKFVSWTNSNPKNVHWNNVITPPLNRNVSTIDPSWGSSKTRQSISQFSPEITPHQLFLLSDVSRPHGIASSCGLSLCRCMMHFIFVLLFIALQSYNMTIFGCYKIHNSTS